MKVSTWMNCLVFSQNLPDDSGGEGSYVKSPDGRFAIHGENIRDLPTIYDEMFSFSASNAWRGRACRPRKAWSKFEWASATARNHFYISPTWSVFSLIFFLYFSSILRKCTLFFIPTILSTEPRTFWRWKWWWIMQKKYPNILTENQSSHSWIIISWSTRVVNDSTEPDNSISFLGDYTTRGKRVYYRYSTNGVGKHPSTCGDLSNASKAVLMNKLWRRWRTK